MNITTRIIEIRDNGTCIPALVIYTHPLTDPHGAAWILRSAGWHSRGVLLMRLADGRGHSDPYDWNDRTHQAAHEWLCVCRQSTGRPPAGCIVDAQGMWLDGAVLDVRVYLGEASEAVRSDSYAGMGERE